MGWYDAYKKDSINPQALNMIDSNKGLGASAFGDAFKGIGKAVGDYNDNVDKDELNKKTNALTDLKLENEATKVSDLAEAKTEANLQKENKKYSDAFKKDLLTIDGVEGKQALIDYANTNEDKFYGDNGVDFESMKFGKDLIDKDLAKDEKRKNEIAALEQKKKDLKMQNKINKLTLENGSNANGTKEEQNKRTKHNFFNKLAKEVTPFTENNLGKIIYDTDQLNFKTDYMEKNYDKNKHPTYDILKKEAQDAYVEHKKQERLKGASAYLSNEIPYWDKLSSAQQQELKDNYVENGDILDINESSGLFGTNTKYTLPSETKKQEEKDKNQEAKKKQNISWRDLDL